MDIVVDYVTIPEIGCLSYVSIPLMQSLARDLIVPLPGGGLSISTLCSTGVACHLLWAMKYRWSCHF